MSGLVQKAELNLKRLDTIIQSVRHCLDPSKSKYEKEKARILWMTKKREAHNLQEDIKSIRLNICNHLIASSSMSIETLGLTVTEISSKINALLDHQNETARRNKMLKTQINQKLDKTVTALAKLPKLPTSPQFLELINAVANLREARNSSFPNNNILHVDNKTIRVVAQWRIRCLSDCSCACHHSSMLHTPRHLFQYLGMLFVGYSGFPLSFFNRSHLASYTMSRGFRAAIVYYFPGWFVRRQILITLASNYNDLIQFRLRIPRMFPADAEIFQRIRSGDLVGVRSLLSKRQASPFDICEEHALPALQVH